MTDQGHPLNHNLPLSDLLTHFWWLKLSGTSFWSIDRVISDWLKLLSDVIGPTITVLSSYWLNHNHLYSTIFITSFWLTDSVSFIKLFYSTVWLGLSLMFCFLIGWIIYTLLSYLLVRFCSLFWLAKPFILALLSDLLIHFCSHFWLVESSYSTFWLVEHTHYPAGRRWTWHSRGVSPPRSNSGWCSPHLWTTSHLNFSSAAKRTKNKFFGLKINRFSLVRLNGI